MNSSLSLTDLGGGSGKSWSPEVGDKISGVIIGITREQQTDFQTGAPLSWSNGDPRMQTVVELQTDERVDDDDDGVRSLWLKGGKNFEAASGSGHSGEVALAMAAKEAGADSIDEGARLQVVCSGLAKPTTRGFQPAKLYSMKYEAPKASVSAGDLFG